MIRHQRSHYGTLDALWGAVHLINDDAPLDRMQELAEQCGERIESEKERRKETSFENMDDVRAYMDQARKRWAGADAEKAKRKREGKP